MKQFFQQIINGLSLGSIYALISLGYTMVYGIIRLINFAHGDIYMLGAYIGFLLSTKLGFPFFPTLMVSMVLCALIGIFIEKIAYKPLRNSSRIVCLITAIGVSYLIEALSQNIFGSSPQTYPNLLPSERIEFLGLSISFQQLVIFITTIVLMIVLQIIVRKTKIGRAMRCVALDQEASQLMGVNVNLVITVTFAIGSALAGASGVLVGIYYNSIDPLMGTLPGIKAFIAAVFGGIGSIPGALIGGLFIGVSETLISAYGSSLYKDGFVYIILILVLIIKPQGLLGKNIKEKV